MKFVVSVVCLVLAAAASLKAAAPTVTIRTPVNGATFSIGATLTVIASASDSDGTVTNVQFFHGSTRIGQASTATAGTDFTVIWSNIDAGTYSLTAVATDNTGLSTTSPAIGLNVTILAANSLLLIPSEATWKYLDDGSNQGTAWTAASFPDAAWASGAAQIGYGDGDEVTTVGFGPDAANKFITTYFRKTFVVTNAARITNLTAHVIRDDGVVVYLNGNEGFRNNMPGGAITSGTLALSPAIGGSEESITFITGNISPSFLVEGTNILAAEIHQQALNSSDISFDLELIGDLAPAGNQPPTATITSPSNNTIFTAGTNVTIDVTATDDTQVAKVEFFQAPSGEAPAKLGEDTTNPYSLTWSNVAAGSYILTAVATDNVGLSSTSAPVKIAVTSTGPVTLIPASADWKYLDTGVDPGGTWIAVGFNDSAWQSGPAELGYGDGDESTVVGFGADANNKYPTTYFRHSFNVANPALLSSLSCRLRRDDGIIVYLNGTEVFRDNMPANPITYLTYAATTCTDDGNQWFTNSVDNNLLLAGNNVLAAEIHQATPTSSDISFILELAAVGPSVGNSPPTATISSPTNNASFNAPAIVNITASGFDSDGSISQLQFFANGISIGSASTNPASINWSNAVIGSFTLTAVATDNGGALGTSAPVNITFTGSGPATLVSTGAVWKYLDTGVDLGTAWIGSGFNDSTWQFGPAELGYGDGDEATVVSFGPNPNNKFVTTYFRHAFNVPNPGAYSSMTCRLRRDDGIILYLNGTEIFRDNMPATGVNYLTFASTTCVDDGTQWFTTTVNSSLLVTGGNVLAVEIHQATPTSSDISFILELIGNTGAISNSPPSVLLTSPANNATYTEPANITVSASASDSDGTISKVEFFVAATNKIGESASAPFGTVWGNVPAGTYQLSAVATDNLGARSTSSVATVFVVRSSAPTISSVAPVPGAISNLSQITVTFDQPVTGVDAADLLINNVAASAVGGSNAVYTFSFPQPKEGTVAITWAANHGIFNQQSPPAGFDSHAAGATWQYTLIDTVAPATVKTSPLPGAVLTSLSEIKITFSEPVGGVDASDLLINGSPATSISGSGAGPYSFEFSQPTNGPVMIAWAAGHGIHDFAAAHNPFAGGSWNYTLDTTLAESAIKITEIMYEPSSERTDEEYIELLNTGAVPIHLNGWKLKKAVAFTFPDLILQPGAYLAVVANTTAFATKYPGVTNIVGNWDGQLSNHGDDLTLEDALGNQVDHVPYAPEGDWGIRQRGPLDNNHQGWQWYSEDAGGGKSLELINPAMPNTYGQNWRASLVNNGTPGRPNSVAAANIAPLILDVTHFPVIPKSTNTVAITARIIDELQTGLSVSLFSRIGSNAYAPVTMFDDGAHNDGAANDGVYGAVLPAQPNGSVVEFYVQASDASANTRTWPAPASMTYTSTGPPAGPFAQFVNAMYQVDDAPNTNSQPTYRLIMNETERAELDHLGAVSPDANSDAQMNGTFISIDGTSTELHYLAGFRNRGNGTRTRRPNNYKVSLRDDDPWKGVSAFNLNTQFTESQLAGFVLSLNSGLNSEFARAVQVRVNSTNLANAGSPQFGSYIALESIDRFFAKNQFPDDAGGNVYRCQSPGHVADLSWQGTSVSAYTSRGYSKQSNQGENDWTDFIHMIDVLNNTPDATYAQEVPKVINVEEWMRYFAVLTLLESEETALGVGVGDDYSLYRGLKDTRFLVLPHDHDTVLNEGDTGGNVSQNVFRMAALPVVNRLIKHPAFVPIYFKELKRIADSSFSPPQLNLSLDQALGPFVPTTVINNMKTFAAARRSYVLSQIPLTLTVSSSLSVSNGYLHSTSPTLALNGSANVIDTRFVKINGSFAAWTAWQGIWNISSVPLQPGINHVLVQCLGENNIEVARTNLDVWYDTGASTSVGGTLASSTTWTAAGGPYFASSSLTIPAGLTLTIEAGATVYFGAGVHMTVNGQLLAQGNDAQHIRFTRQPGGANWGSIDFISTTTESRIAYVDFEFCGGTSIGGHDAQVHVNNSIVFIDHCTWPPTPVVEYISFDGSSFIVQNCYFPTYPPPSGPESLHGVNGIPANGYGIIRDNYFGHTWGFNDTIDFTGGQRPGAILQVIHNVFDGATDDNLDLDSTDAWIEGNIFMHVHRDPTRTDDARDTSSAISGGVDFANQFSEWTVINNLFYDVDHAILNKGGGSPGAGRFIFVNNTLVHVAKEWGAGLTTDIAAFDFTDDGVPLPASSYGAGAYIAGNIIWDCPALTANYNPANHTVIFDNNLLPSAWSGSGSNNIVADPMLHLELINNTTNADWQTVKAALTPRPGSPALRTGIGGFDRGGLNPPGLLIYGEPPETTSSSTAMLTVAPGGTFNWGTLVPPYEWGYTHYKWKLDNGPWSAETSITTSPTITLSNLSNGPHSVYVTGKNDAPPGYYQDDPFVYPPTAGIPAHLTSSRTWIVNTNLSSVRLNELLARNDSAVSFGTKYPDLIELYNSANTDVNLTGKSLTDDPSNPSKFVFPANTIIPAAGYLVLFADSDSTPAGIHVGFQLDSDGEAVYFFDSTGELIDSIAFGPQLPDLSIGRLNDGSWALTVPTFGGANIAQRTGDQTRLKINEWLTDGATFYQDDFIELYNPDSLPVDLSGMFLTDNFLTDRGQSVVPPLSFIAANGFAVFTADGSPDKGPTHLNFKLAPEEGMIGLSIADLTLVDSVIYGPQSTDISQGRSPNGSTNYAFFTTPTPGSPNPAPVNLGGQIVINEVFANNVSIVESDGSTPDWVELYNPSGTNVNIGDMSLSDSTTLPRRYVFASGTIIPPGGYLILLCDGSLPASPTNSGFGLKKTGGAVYLYDKLANGGSLMNSILYGIQAPDFAIGRIPNGSSNWVLTLPTRGGANIAASLGLAANLRINEWMAAPASGEDWFEVFNPNPQPVAIGGMYLTDDLTALTKYHIPPLSFIGINLLGYQRFWADNNVGAGADHTNFKLNNSGESIGISSASAALIDGINFGSQDVGVSEGRLPDGSGDIVRFPNSPTPGDSNFLPLDNVVVNEVLSHSIDPLEDAIELFNPTASPVAIGGWYLSNAKHRLAKFRIPDGTVLDAGGYKVFYQYQFNPIPGDPASFTLNGAKDEQVYLSVATPAGQLTGFRAEAKFGPADLGVSMGRYQTSIGIDFVRLTHRTFGSDNPDTLAEFRSGAGASNAYPMVGPIVISEIMYHPPNNGTNDNVQDEFIELHNISAASVPLYHPTYTSNVWRLRDAVDFDFPTGLSVPPNGYILVVSFDPATNALALAEFRSRYSLDSSVPILGPYRGKLDNGSDNIELYMPDAPLVAPDPDAGLVPFVLVDRVKYDDTAPWPAAADGTGNSVQRVNELAYGNDPINWIAAAPTPGPAASNPDRDHDGMPDAWEIAHGLNPDDPSDAAGDADHDGVSNLDEYLCGTDPQDPQSVLKLQIVSINPAALQFNLMPNTSYTIQYQDALQPGGPWQTLISFSAQSTGQLMQVTDGAAVPTRFYRIRTPRLP